MEERKEHEQKLEKVFNEFGVQWVGTGFEHDHSKGAQKQVEETEDDYDPYNMLGYGFQAYFNTLRTFSWVFLLLTVIMLPAFAIYA